MSGTSSNTKYNKKKSTGSNGVQSEWNGFVDIPLDTEDKNYLKEMSREAADVLGILCALAEEGYKLSLSPDIAHGAYIATATGRVPGSANVGRSLSARGPDLLGAINALWYKHALLAESGDWSNVGNQRDGSGYR